MKQKIAKILFTNYLILAYWFVSIVMELTAIAVAGGGFYIRKPWIYLSLMLIFTAGMYAIRNQSGRLWYGFALMVANFVVDLVFIVIYEMTGTIFDYSMLTLRNDGMAIIESLPINFVYVSVSGLLISAYLVFGRYFSKRAPKPAKANKIWTAVTSVVMACTLGLHAIFIVGLHNNHNPGIVMDKLYRNDTASYTDRGVLGTLFDELYKGTFFNNIDVGDMNELHDYIYKEVSPTTSMTGKAKGYNVVTILGETLEWTAFMSQFPESDFDDFPSGFPNDDETKAKLRTLYPNLYKFYDESVAMTNFHAREKTDISENLSSIGCYPTEKITNYDYPKNTIVTSLARTYKALYENASAKSFHNGTTDYYNRKTYLENAAGFESFTGQDEMVEAGMTSYIPVGERNLDSDMIDTCYEEMFPTDRPFYTYITTITQHGQYEERENLKPYYDLLDENGLAPAPEKDDKDFVTKKNFRTYVAASMELDAALGRIDDYLEARGLKENTIVVLFGDHNAYYSSLSNDVKGIKDRDYEGGRNYTDLYRIPLMIRIGDGQYAQKVTKFTCTADILPTIYDLLGIRTFSNLLYGQSVFTESESVLYSRAYDVFFTDKIFFSSLNRIYYKGVDVDAAYMKWLEETSRILLDKIGHTNRIFFCDYFQGERGVEYFEKLKALQQA